MSTKKGRYGNPAKRVPLAGDLARLAQPSGAADPRTLGGGMSGPGGPRDAGAVLLDMTDIVILESVETAQVDAVRRGYSTGNVTYMTLSGRVNKTDRQVRVGFVFDTRGSAAIISDLLSLADRSGAEFLNDLTERLVTQARVGTVDLAFLRAALDLAMTINGDA